MKLEVDNPSDFIVRHNDVFYSVFNKTEDKMVLRSYFALDIPNKVEVPLDMQFQDICRKEFFHILVQRAKL